MIRTVRSSDIPVLLEIYNHYILHSPATFEEETIDGENMGERIHTVHGLGLPWLVAEEGGQTVGYAYANRWRERSAYRHSVEVTVYIAPEHIGEGWGRRLYQALFDSLRQNNIHVALAGITLPNAASVALHEKMGMRKVAHLEEVGFKQGQWLDVGYWQINFQGEHEK
ncbi:GNAT family N-acetyltransferase [Pseudohalioglobus lutimaris]|uniref:N-acetyltransferase n=1 Tax=Pseudohalioglobus lutimaris TaxID=1737061 RepID=A0A2N5X4L9_9GAMM|nr:GNAT family N-acetyltransferase [Pseudohalioglobus lutimaris]PLW69434.1 N-acetyltransferase [Pseudohalioglobus lutimaris]